MNKPMRKLTATAVMLAFAGTSGHLMAETEKLAENKIELDAISVNGILPEKLESVPGSFDVVDKKELEEKRPFSVKEALSATPGINIVGEDSFGLGLNIGIRGMDPRRTARTLLMEDGMPLFLAPYGDPSAHYSTPMDRVDRIEVVKGSGQILYGPQTVGGMINFVTKPVPRNGFAGSITGAVGNNDFYSGHLNLGVGNERGGIMVDAIKKSGDGIRDNHKFDVEEFTVKGEVKLTDSQSLMAKASYYKEDSNISETGLGLHEYNQDKFQAPSGQNDLFKHERKSLQLKHIFDINEKVKLTTQAYYSKSDRKSFRQVDAPGGYDSDNGTTGYSVLDRCDPDPVTTANANACGGRWRPREYTYWGIEPRLDVKHNLFGIDSDAVVGFRYHDEDIERNQYRDEDPRAQSLSWAKAFGTHREQLKHKVEAFSYYAQNTFHVGDWSLTPGVRVEDYKVSQNVVIAESEPQGIKGSKSTTEVLPGFGVAWNGIANTTFFGGVHRGFAPARPDRDLLANADDQIVLNFTKPELSTNYEIGVRSKYFKGTSFSSTLFHTNFDDLVINAGGGNYENAGKSRMSGLELAGRVDFGTIYNTPHNFYVTGSYTNTFTAEFKKSFADEGINSGNRLPYAPRHIASVNFGYQHPVGFNARIGADYVSEQKPDAWTNTLTGDDAALSGLTGTIPSYTLVNASASFKPVGSKLTYFVSGHNLTDKEYLATRVDGMGVGRGRQVFGGVRIDF
jgi:Fe(3+) dicitrate transport protein